MTAPVPHLSPSDVDPSLRSLLYQQLSSSTGPGRSLRAETQATPRSIIAELGRIFGGNWNKVAQVTGISTRSLRRYRNEGTTPSRVNEAKLRATLPMRRRARLPAGREAWMRGKPFVGIIAYTANGTPGAAVDRRRRKFNPTPYLPAGALGPTLDAFLRGEDMTQVAYQFALAIEQHYGGVRVMEVERLVIAKTKPIWWEALRL